MKYLIILTLFLVSCDDSRTNKENEEKTSNWINTHPKPIICKKAYGNGLTLTTGYTLIDSNNHIFNTGLVYFELPDTLN